MLHEFDSSGAFRKAGLLATGRVRFPRPVNFPSSRQPDQSSSKAGLRDRCRMTSLRATIFWQLTHLPSSAAGPEFRAFRNSSKQPGCGFELVAQFNHVRNVAISRIAKRRVCSGQGL